jgi:Bacterial Ig-like domain (group 2)
MQTRIVTKTIAVAAPPNPAAASGRQRPALLEISSPADGSVISPGQTVSVTVISPAGARFDHITLIGTGEIGFVNALATSLPAQFWVAIPPNMTCRSHTFTAIGRTASGQDASASILIDVEKPDMPSEISARLRQIIFDGQGDSCSIRLLGTFGDGSVLDVTESSNVSFSSLNAAVATVEGCGLVTAVAPGRSSILATYGPQAQNIQLRIPITVPPAAAHDVPRPARFRSTADRTCVNRLPDRHRQSH